MNHLPNFQPSSRRTFLQDLTALGMMLSPVSCTVAADRNRSAQPEKKRPFRISINVSTLSGFKLPVKEQIRLSAAAGFEGIELWTSDVYRYVQDGGDAGELKALLDDSGLMLENLIAFSDWLSNDARTSAQGMEQMKKDMALAAQLGGHHVAATGGGLDVFLPDRLELYCRQYAEIVRLGQSFGVTPLLELWGHGTLNKLWKVLAIASGSHCPDAQLLLDFYHLHAGGNPFSALSLISGAALPVFHINDYPGDIPAETLRDSDRVYPGDGICPFDQVIPMLYRAGFRGALSLELFNASYWNGGTPRQVLDTGFAKTVAVVDKALTTLQDGTNGGSRLQQPDECI
ncbi:MAG: sugar phosphate isomerase/epimerase [Tannerella sp.]|jgi:sugar phosphate isomerase/epimerase|nr:sugar phosphate isomerase/epimerase [Tannerella sp.]